VTFPKIRSRIKRWPEHISFNITRFIDEISKEEFTPVRYLTLN